MSDIRKITIDEVKESNLFINKRLVLIDSSLYTDDAFEYVRTLIDKNEAIAFITDTRKIYTQGQYFGGDLWEDMLFFFGDYRLLDENGEEITTLKAELMKEQLNISSSNHILISASEKYVEGEKTKTLNIGLDINGLVDETAILTELGEYKLTVENNKIKLDKYVPIKVGSTTLPMLEYDTQISNVQFNLFYEGSNGVRNVEIYSSPSQTVEISEDLMTVTTTITQNTTNAFIVRYNDGVTFDHISLLQTFGFACVYSNTEITSRDFMTYSRYISDESCDGEFTITQAEGQYGYFACPSIYTPIFKDYESSMSGGWEKIRTLRIYTLNIEYTVYRTEQTGLGTNKWIVNEIEYHSKEKNDLINGSVIMKFLEEKNKLVEILQNDFISAINTLNNDVEETHRIMIENQRRIDEQQDLLNRQINERQDVDLTSIKNKNSEQDDDIRSIKDDLYSPWLTL